jgi:SpoVK/Ycf46/Vps4 family AAA+-type ATPase
MNRYRILDDFEDDIEHHMDEMDSSTKRVENPSKWSPMKGDEYMPSYPTVEKIPSGLYEIKWNSTLQSHTLKQLPMQVDELYALPSAEITAILDDIECFWNRREVYQEYNFVHKRGILLYGEPGCGKSGIIQLCVKHIIEEKGGIVINIKDEEEVKMFSEFIGTIKSIEPERPIITILEDIDSLAGEDRYSTTKLLNILDGIKQVDNIVYIATTNYPEKLQERITNRPSRFDRRYQVELPSADIREAYLRAKLKEDDLEKIDLPAWLELTEGMSLSHLKELVISVIVMRKNFNDAINHLIDLKKAPKTSKKSNLGFKS